mgnify:FL=1|tara:strand:+ start:104 stop:982 length:879 start_codon:yes stop_codon:yes gene_type:complete
MSEHMKEVQTDTLIAGENVQPVGTETEVEAVADTNSEEKVKNTDSGPKVEYKDGKTFVDGTRVYSRDETNIIASRTRKEVEQSILNDLDVESFDKVKQVVSELRSTDIADNSLNVQSLRDAVAKREQTVEELKAELQAVKTDYALKEHIGTLKDNMPQQWNGEQKSAVVDLMKARDMLQLEGETFAIKYGDDFYTTDGDTPDYKTAVEVVGKSLGLPFAKKGVESFDADKQPSKIKESGKSIDELVKSDPALRNAFVKLRGKGIAHSDITEGKLREYASKSQLGDSQSRITR